MMWMVSIKNKYLNVSHHMNDDAKYVVKNVYSKHNGIFTYKNRAIIRIRYRSYYFFHFNVYDVFYKAKYGMVC